MKIVRAVFELFTDYSPERETRRKLTESRLTLVQHECDREYFNASVPMLRERVTRLEEEVAVIEAREAEERAKKEIRKHSHTQAPAPARDGSGFNSVFTFPRRQAAR